MSGNSALAEQFVYKHGIVTRAIFDHKNLLIDELTRAPSSAYSGLFMLLLLGKLPLEYRMRPERSGRRIAGFHRDYIPMESSEWLGCEVSCTDAPSAFAKIAAIALLEATRNAKTRSLITFGADTRADINIPGDIDYGTLLAADGAGCCRLDLALASLLHIRWDLQNGERQLIILTGTPPETGAGVQMHLLILAQMGLIDTRIGAYMSRTFSQRIHNLRIVVSVIGRVDTFVHALRGGSRQMLQQSPNHGC